MMCKVLKVSKSGYYKWLENQKTVDSEKEKYKREIRQKIKKSYHESEGMYESPRVHNDLVKWGYTISQKTVARIMKELGLRAIPARKVCRT
jgi:putative transposase